MTKPEGFEFWRTKLKSARLVVAPMVDQSELAWRMLSRRYGAELCYTPMFHATLFARDPTYRRDCLQTCESDRPLIVQFCANDPDTFVKAAKLAESQCDAIDLNLGCPQSIARRGHYGAFIQDEWELLEKMVKLCHAELKVPITCKIRVFESLEKTVRYAQMLEKAGCQLLTVHGRTKEQKGPQTGVANWDYIKAVRERVQIPVYANGNIQFFPDVEQCIKETGVQGVMSAEGNLHNPALFSGQQPPVWEMVGEYLDLVDKYPCPISYVRGHVFKILHHSLQVHQDVREEVATAKTVEDFRLANKHIEERCQEDMAKFAVSPEEILTRTILPLPYWICQPYIRPGPNPNANGDKRAERDRLNLKRNNELNALAMEGLSRNKLKKMLRHPKKNFDPSHKLTYDTCATCCNPKGQKCEFSLCKGCCKKKSLQEILDCAGHNLSFKTKAERKRLESEQQSAACEASAAAGASNGAECQQSTSVNRTSADPSTEDLCSTDTVPCETDKHSAEGSDVVL
ncbi:tRNA-dihydrouridine(16/17) synthase [NAD(P)(+)]-like [Haliotis cracherodii]|uniref:tRNA-dihydrouridine(16/17) synthase [NAD(P)(+)]-like n=1 Tax=Haliotis cracherodii TaxID=6455 RepID=UPI0039EC231C